MVQDFDEDERLVKAVLRYRRFNERVPSEKMRIVDCARVWRVSRSALREELEWLTQVTNSDYNDIMQ